MTTSATQVEAPHLPSVHVLFDRPRLLAPEALNWANRALGQLVRGLHHGARTTTIWATVSSAGGARFLQGLRPEPDPEAADGERWGPYLRLCQPDPDSIRGNRWTCAAESTRLDVDEVIIDPDPMAALTTITSVAIWLRTGPRTSRDIGDVLRTHRAMGHPVFSMDAIGRRVTCTDARALAVIRRGLQLAHRERDRNHAA